MADVNSGKIPSKKHTRRKRRQVLLIFEIIILLLLLAIFFVWLKFGMVNFSDISVKRNELSEETLEKLSGYTNIAFFGVDNRKSGNYDTGNSDSIMVCSINNDTKEIRLISIYRDSFLDVGNGTFRKCNYAYNHGGVSDAMQMLNTNLDLNLNEYVSVDFKALTYAIDAVGGIEIEVTEEEIKALEEKPIIQEVAKAAGKEATPITSPGKQILRFFPPCGA